MDTAFEILMAVVAMSGWVAFWAIDYLNNKINDAWREANRVQEDRHLRDIGIHNNQAQQLQVLSGMNGALIREIYKLRGSTGADDGDWWKRGGKPPGN